MKKIFSCFDNRLYILLLSNRLKNISRSQHDLVLAAIFAPPTFFLVDLIFNARFRSQVANLGGAVIGFDEKRREALCWYVPPI